MPSPRLITEETLATFLVSSQLIRGESDLSLTQTHYRLWVGTLGLGNEMSKIFFSSDDHEACQSYRELGANQMSSKFGGKIDWKKYPVSK